MQNFANLSLSTFSSHVIRKRSLNDVFFLFHCHYSLCTEELATGSALCGFPSFLFPPSVYNEEVEADPQGCHSEE